MANENEIDDFLSESNAIEPPQAPAQDNEPAPAPGSEPAPEPPVQDGVPPASVPSEGAPPPPAAVPPAEAPPTVPPQEPQKTKEQELEETISALRTQLEAMATKVAGEAAPGALPAAGQPPAQDLSIQPQQGQGQGQGQEPIPVLEFVKTDAEFDEALRTPENFNRLLTGVVYKSIESTLRSVPQMVVKLADQQITTRSAINEFYEQNKDLIPSKAFVGAVAQEMAVKNPTWKLEELLGNLGKEVRTRLRMIAPVSGPGVQPSGAPGQPPQAPQPAFAGTGGSGKGRPGDARSALQKDIDDLISD